MAGPWKYRVRWAEHPDSSCAVVTASSPQHAAEAYVECSGREVEDGQELDVVVVEDRGRRHNVVVTASRSWSFEARKPRDLQGEDW